MDLDALIPGYLAARLVGVSKQLVYRWQHRPTNPLVPAEHAPDGRPLFRVRDVLAVERETRHSPRSSRRQTTAA
jgi:hypothetical protein